MTASGSTIRETLPRSFTLVRLARSLSESSFADRLNCVPTPLLRHHQVMTESQYCTDEGFGGVTSSFWRTLIGIQGEWRDHGFPNHFFHYTTTAALQSICKSRSIWATDVFYLNDSSEYSYAVDLINEVANEVYSSVDPQWRNHFLMDPLSQYVVLTRRRQHPFIASFCEDGDLLSQWRGYSKGDAGVALGFRFHPNEQLDGFLVRKVVYDEDEQRAIVRRIVQAWVDTYIAMVDATVGSPRLADYSVLSQALFEQIHCFKHPSFAEEKEWRFIAFVDPRHEINLRQMRRADAARLRMGEQNLLVGEDHSTGTLTDGSLSSEEEGVDLKFRPTPNGLVPYVEMNMAERAGLRKNLLPLRAVVQGPRENPALALESLKMYLAFEGYEIPDISASGIPLRDS